MLAFVIFMALGAAITVGLLSELEVHSTLEDTVVESLRKYYITKK